MTFLPTFELSSLDGNNGFVLNGMNDFDYLGRSVSSAGDVNGDGLDDITIGATGVDSNGQYRSGQSYVIFGRIGGFSASFDPSSLDGTNGFAINGINAYDFSGHAVSSAGDVNGDGFDDIIISAYGADPNGQLNSGQSYVVFGRKRGFSSSLNLSSLDGTNGFAINGIKAYDFSGNAVSSAGDVNGDGFADIIIGARFASSSSQSASGQSYVVFGRSGGLSSSLDLSTLDGSNGLVINGIKSNEHLGNSVGSAGDVNGDGFDDLIIGTAFVDANNQYRSGQSYVVFGRSAFVGASFDLASLNGSNGFALNETNAGDFPNRSVSSAGDVNGDGLGDLIIGVYGSDPKDKFFAGQSYVVFGQSGGFSSSLDLSTLNGNNGFTINGIDFGDRSGTSVSSAGDVNGDGFDDLLIGAIGASPNGQFNSGQSYVVFGRSGGFSSSLDLSTLNGGNGFALNGIQVGDQSGSVVSSAGDVNGDGFDDILIGSNFADSNENETSSSGQSYVVFGQATLPSISLVVSPSSVKEDGITPLVYTFTRTGSLINPLTISYTISGTATNGTDYQTIGNTVIFAAGSALATVTIDPTADTTVEPDETISLTLATVAGYSITTAAVTGTIASEELLSFGAVLELSSLDGINGFAIDGLNAFDYSGQSVSGAGDVNGDGFDDFIIGAFRADPKGENSGQSYVVFGRSGGFNANLNLSTLNGANGFAIDGINAFDYTGISVSSAGDVNGDGFDDLIMGATGVDDNSGSSGFGQSYVVFGRGGGFSSHLNLSTLDGSNGFAIKGLNRYDYLGNSVSSAGDVNGDGFDDLIIGAKSVNPNGQGGAGQSYVIFGCSDGFGANLSLSTLDGTNGFAINGINQSDYSGHAVSMAGDINGDGFDDLIIGAIGADPRGKSNAGQGYVVFGHGGSFNASLNLSSLNGSNGFAISGIKRYDQLGWSVSDAGDVNGDGFDDLIIGASGADPYSQNESGQSYVVFGRRGGFRANLNLATLNGTNGFAINGISSVDASGRSVSRAGDVNGDGFDDLIIGAPGAGPNGYNSGQSYVVFGRSGGFSASLNLSNLNGINGFTLNGINKRHGSGESVSSAGDINGDGLSDLIIGARRADSSLGSSESGQSYVILGQAFGLPLPSINLTVSSPTVAEDGAGNLIYTFTRTGSLTNPLTVNYTLKGTAQNGTDYETLGKKITFLANSAIAQVMVNPIADTQIEPDETVTLTIARGTGYSIGRKKKAIATLLADEPLTTLSINNVTILEGQDTQAVLTVKISDPPSRLIRVNYSTTPLSATADADYTPQTGTITIAANATTATISIPIRDDDLNEPQESFLVTLSNPVNAILNPTATSGIVTLTDTLSSDSTVTLPRAIENLKLTGNQAINGTGNAQNNILRGNSASNILTGLGGNDTYVFVADSPLGVDTIIETAPSAFFAGGRDTLAFRSTQVGIIIDLGNSNAQTVVPGNLTLKLSAGDVIENVRGGKGNDQITGNALDNRLNGGPGDDLLLGGGGKDGFTYNTQQAFLASEIGRDTLADFTPSVDKLILGKTTFTALTSDQAKGFSQASEFAVVDNDALVASSIAFIVYSSSSGSLFYNQNGTALGLGTGAEFAKLANNPTIAASDFVLVA